MYKETDLLSTKFAIEAKKIETHLQLVIREWNPLPIEPLKKLWDSVEYSLFSTGKRFRPLLTVLTAEALRADVDQVLPLSSAVELIHTYSLIHDDLPTLDNDDLRRGRATNHKVFGEAMALLAGDGLLTLAFFVLAKGLKENPKATDVIERVSRAAGLAGMVGGQVLDITDVNPNEDSMNAIHRMKTGALIQVSVEASAVICRANEKDQKNLNDFGRALGLAFQLADDLQDAGEKMEKVNFVHVLGPERTIQLLRQATDEGLAALKGFGTEADGLRFLLEMNRDRISL
jgi:geranylgeranyl diphosphate synthase type II